MPVIAQEAVCFEDDDVFVLVEKHEQELSDVDLLIEALESLEIFTGKQQTLGYITSKSGADELGKWLMSVWEESADKMISYMVVIAELVYEAGQYDGSIRDAVSAFLLQPLSTVHNARSDGSVQPSQ